MSRRGKPPVRHVDGPEKDIAATLDRVTRLRGYGFDQVFEDWLQVVEATLEMLPRHFESAYFTGTLGADTPAVAALWDDMRGRYGAEGLTAFSEAFGQLLAATTDERGRLTYRDMLGTLYMGWAYPNTGTGQFFTPWPVAKAMTEMAMLDAEPLVRQRLRAAFEQSPLAQALVGALALVDHAQPPQLDLFTPRWDPSQYFLTAVLPLLMDHYEPVSIVEPCVGSGVMLLAAASALPTWMVQLGLVTFTGTDVDMTCVRMARINCRLYGLRGTPLLRRTTALGPLEPTALEAEPAAAHARGPHEGDPDAERAGTDCGLLPALAGPAEP
jgi:hypothetical protein